MDRTAEIAEAFSRWKRTWELSRKAQAALEADVAAAKAGHVEFPPPQAHAHATALTQEADRLLLIASHLLHELAPAVPISAGPNCNTIPKPVTVVSSTTPTPKPKENSQEVRPPAGPAIVQVPARRNAADQLNAMRGQPSANATARG